MSSLKLGIAHDFSVACYFRSKHRLCMFGSLPSPISSKPTTPLTTANRFSPALFQTFEI